MAAPESCQQSLQGNQHNLVEDMNYNPDTKMLVEGVAAVLDEGPCPVLECYDDIVLIYSTHGDSSCNEQVDVPVPDASNAMLSAAEGMCSVSEGRETEQKGRAIIFSTRCLDGQSRWDIAEQTRQRLSKLVNITVSYHQDLDSQGMVDCIRTESCHSSLKDVSFLFVALYHGCPNWMVTTDGKGVHIEQDIISHFKSENCQALAGKPKIFFVQTCRSTITKCDPPLFPNYRKPEMDQELHDFLSKLIPPLDMKQLRVRIVQVYISVYSLPIDSSKKSRAVKKIWNHRPPDWPDTVPYADPNNRDKAKNRLPKAALQQMFAYLVIRYYMLFIWDRNISYKRTPQLSDSVDSWPKVDQRTEGAWLPDGHRPIPSVTFQPPAMMSLHDNAYNDDEDLYSGASGMSPAKISRDSSMSSEEDMYSAPAGVDNTDNKSASPRKETDAWHPASDPARYDTNITSAPCPIESDLLDSYKGAPAAAGSSFNFRSHKPECPSSSANFAAEMENSTFVRDSCPRIWARTAKTFDDISKLSDLKSVTKENVDSLIITSQTLDDVSKLSDLESVTKESDGNLTENAGSDDAVLNLDVGSDSQPGTSSEKESDADMTLRLTTSQSWSGNGSMQDDLAIVTSTLPSPLYDPKVEEERKLREELHKLQENNKEHRARINILTQELSKLESRKEDLMEKWTCKVCLTGGVNRVFLPCRHLVCCNQCAPRLKSCPLCREVIRSIIHITVGAKEKIRRRRPPPPVLPNTKPSSTNKMSEKS